METKHTPGAISAAEIITDGKYGESNKYNTAFGYKTTEGIADIIDRETAAPDLLAALESTVRGDQFSDMTILLDRAGHPQLAKFWREYRETACAAIAKAKGK